MKEYKKFTFDKNCSQFIKALSILMMLMHHFWGYPDWLYNGNKCAGIFGGDIPVEMCLAGFFKLCVAFFAFVTGYGMFFVMQKEHYLKKVIKKAYGILVTYWLIIFLVYLPAYFLINRSATAEYISAKEIILGMFGISNKINRFSWYIYFYLLAIFTLPVYKRIMSKNQILALCGALIPFKAAIFIINHGSFDIPRLFLNCINNYLNYMSVILIGYIFAKYNTFDTLSHFLYRLRLDKAVTYALIIFVIFIFRDIIGGAIFGTNIDAVYTPFLILALGKMSKKINNMHIVDFLARHSLNFWLLHGIFFPQSNGLTFLQNLVYFPRIPILIVVWAIVLMLPVSVMLKKICRILHAD
ncbi:MAG: acyltransferase [Firmicutes bacterium]|nr:acyltransferase [Bacillota bacterium]